MHHSSKEMNKHLSLNNGVLLICSLALTVTLDALGLASISEFEELFINVHMALDSLVIGERQRVIILRISTSKGNHKRDIAISAMRKHQFVSILNAFARQLQVAEAIFGIDINSCLIKHQVRLHMVEEPRKPGLQDMQILIVLRSLGQLNIHIAQLLV